MTFLERLQAASQANQSLLCVGLDPQRLPAGFATDEAGLLHFCLAIVEATADLVCAYKPNSAFFEAYGPAGWLALRNLIAAIPPQIPVILDAKRGDIGSTAGAYARAAFEQLGAHAITLNPYLGADALQPFLEYRDRGCFVLCKTSNPGSSELQELVLADGRPLYLEVARRAAEEWNRYGNLGLVAGATFPAQLAEIRSLCPRLPLLVPGVGAQAADLVAAVRNAVDANGNLALINASRSIMYASEAGDFAVAARSAAQQLRDQINLARGPMAGIEPHA